MPRLRCALRFTKKEAALKKFSRPSPRQGRAAKIVATMHGRSRHFSLTLALARHKYFLWLVSTLGKRPAHQLNLQAAPDAFSIAERGPCFSRTQAHKPNQ
jgi:hypothetical protein